MNNVGSLVEGVFTNNSFDFNYTWFIGYSFGTFDSFIDFIDTGAVTYKVGLPAAGIEAF